MSSVLGAVFRTCWLAASLGMLPGLIGTSCAVAAERGVVEPTAQPRRSQPIGISWSGTPLRQAIYHLCQSQQVTALLDRRVDPDQLLELSLGEMPLEKIFREVARKQGLGVTWLGPLAYFGPPQVTTRLRTLAEIAREEARQLPADTAQKLLSSRPFAWPELATPRQLLEQLAAEAGLPLQDIEQVPHDLWAAAQLPPLPLTDRLTVIAVQFDLALQIESEPVALHLTRLPKHVAITRSYPGGRQPAQLAEKLAAMLPEAHVRVAGNRVVVRGLLEDHERIAGHARGSAAHSGKPAKSAEGAKRYTVKQGKGSLDKVLPQLATSLQLELKIDHEALQRAGMSLQQQVTFSVNEATLDELFQAVLAKTGCGFRREGNVIIIGPAK